jgi:hypothetical protein
MSASAEQLDLDAYRTQLGRTVTSTGLRSAAIGDPDLYEMALSVIRVRARTGYVFDADDVRSDLAGASGNAVGSAFRKLASEGVIFVVSLGTSTAPSRHGALIRRWAGVGSG